MRNEFTAIAERDSKWFVALTVVQPAHGLGGDSHSTHGSLEQTCP